MSETSQGQHKTSGGEKITWVSPVILHFFVHILFMYKIIYVTRTMYKREKHRENKS